MKNGEQLTVLFQASNALADISAIARAAKDIVTIARNAIPEYDSIIIRQALPHQKP